MIRLFRKAPDSGRPRRLTASVLRHNPADPASAPHWQDFVVEEAEGMTLFIALNEIRATQDPSLQFDFVCRAGICGSCAMLIDGRPGLACRTLTRDLGERFTLAPLPFFELIGDVVKNAPEHGGQVMYRPGSHRGGCGTWAEDVAEDLSALIKDNAALVAEVRRLRKHAEQEDSE